MKTLLLTILITVINQYSFAYELSDDEKLDIELGALDTPTSVKNNEDLIYLLQIRTREPMPRIPDLKPPFKQQPPGVQDDFREREEESVPRPQPIPDPNSRPNERPPQSSTGGSPNDPSRSYTTVGKYPTCIQSSYCFDSSP